MNAIKVGDQVVRKSLVQGKGVVVSLEANHARVCWMLSKTSSRIALTSIARLEDVRERYEAKRAAYRAARTKQGGVDA